MPGGGGRFFRRYPRDTRVLIGQLAYVFGFGASELLDMEAKELIFWADRLREVNRGF